MDSKPNHLALRQTTASLLAAEGADAFRGAVGSGGQRLPLPGLDGLTVEDAAPHTAITGSTGAGKTILQKTLIAGLLPATMDQGGLSYRALVYDPKRELLSFLTGIGIPESQVIVVHPFDERASAWDVAADFREPAQIEEFSELIVPQQSSHGANSQFFDTSARLILQDVIAGLQVWRPRWELRDLVEACLDRRPLQALLMKTPNGRATWETYLESLHARRDARTAENILQTLVSHVRPFQTLASLWHSAETRFSLEEWHRGSGVLLLGADPRRERTLQRVNALVFKRLSQLLLSRDEDPVDLSWVFLDELREAGKLEGLRQLLTEGRSKGVRVVIGFQDIEGLRSLYGNHEAEEIVGLCANRVVLHLDSPSSRKWASDFFGEAEILDVSRNESSGDQTTRSRSGGSVAESLSRGASYQIRTRANVLPIELHQLRLASPEHGIEGWVAAPGVRRLFRVSPDAVSPLLAKQGVACFLPRPASDQLRIPWNEDDYQGLEFLEEAQPEPRLRKGPYLDSDDNETVL